MPKLVYFASRGRAEVIRLVCAEASIAYEEENFTDFAALKASGRLPFQAVPIWEEDDGFTLAQSYAIVQHLSRGHGLYGSTPREAARVDQALWTAEDLRIEYRKVGAAEPGRRAAVRDEILGTHLPRLFGGLERLLGQGAFLGGEQLSGGDLAVWYATEIARDNGLDAPLAGLPKLSAWYERIAARPKLAAYLRSPKRHAVFKLPV